MKIRSEPSKPQEIPLSQLKWGECFTQPHNAQLLFLTSVVQGKCGYCCCLKSGSLYWISFDAPVIPVDAEVVVTSKYGAPREGN